MPRWKARQALGQGGAKWETKDGIMRTGDAWFLTMSNKELSACTVCVGNAGGSAPLFGSLLSPDRMRGKGQPGVWVHKSPQYPNLGPMCVLLPCRHQCVLFLFNVTPSLSCLKVSGFGLLFLIFNHVRTG